MSCKRFPVIVLFVLMLTTVADAAGFSVVEARTNLKDNVYQLSAELDFQFTEKVEEAVENGIPVTLAVTIRIERPQKYWWPEEISVVTQRYQLQFHALSEQFLVLNLVSGEQSHFSSLYQAIRSVSRITNLPLIDTNDAPHLEECRLRMRTELDLSVLPVPLRLWAYLDSGWALKSDWFEQQLAGAQ